jgi:hypothetical protein
MRIAWWCVLLGALAPVPAAGAVAQEPPKVLLHISFDGSPDADFAATGPLKTSYVYIAYRPGVKAQAAEIGSDRYPSGLLIPCAGILDKKQGAIEFWYMPLWRPSDPSQQRAVRTLLTDEKNPGDMGHFWLAIEHGSVAFALEGRAVQVISAPIHRWKEETWHHLIVSWDSERGVELYVDGERAAERGLRWVLPPSEVLYLGANRCGGNRAEGLFDELRIYDRSLSPTEVELAFIRNLNTKKAPVAAKPEEPEPAAKERKPARVSFYLTFDNVVEAQTAMGDARPAVADGAKFAPGLVGQALVAGPGLNLAYRFEKNLSKEAGAISLWARALPEAKDWRGVLFGDSIEEAESGRRVGGSLALWVQREGVPQAHFALWPVWFRQPLPRWDERDWHHFAATWRRGEDVALYVNGREAGRVKGGGAAWPSEPPKRVHVGCLEGKTPANALIDEMRFYDAPLTPEQVQKEASQFLLPFVFQLDHTLFERGQPSGLVCRFFNPMVEAVEAKLTLRVLSPEGKAVATATAGVEAAARGWGQVRVPLTAEALAHEGLYEVTTSCPGRTACPRTSFLVIAPEPKLPSPTGEASAAPKSEHVETIECAKVSTPQTFCQSGGARVVKSGLGDYVEAGEYPDARIAYRFALSKIDAPHVAIVSYPADRARSAEIVMNSKRFSNSTDVATGYFVGQTEASEPRMVELPVYFWPRERQNALVLRTLLAGQPAACAKITIRRLTEGLPPVAVEEPKEGGRDLGMYWHDPSVPLQFGASSTRAPDVYESFRRLTEYLRFTGQNLLCYPVAWHHGVLYPSDQEGFRLGLGSERYCTDWIEYVLHLCERRGIRFVPVVFFDDSYALSAAYGSHTAEMVARGVPSARMVLWDDTLPRGELGEPPRYNPLHPAARAALLERIGEIVERYGKFPALAGVALHLGPSQSVWFGSIQAGYDDQMISEFEKDSSIQVPEGKSGPTRFSERARWLLANRYDPWVAWRCRRMRQVFGDLASRVQSKRPDLKLYLDVALPDSLSPQPLLSLTAWDERPASLDRIYKEAGLDLSLYDKRPTNLVVRKVTFPVEDRYIEYRLGGRGPIPYAALARDIGFLSEGTAPLRDLPPRCAAVCSYPFFESAVGLLQPMRDFWWQPSSLHVSHPTPAGNRFLEPCVHAIAELDVPSISLGGGALVTMGHETAVRQFARAFRALPPERFADLPGMSDPVCARELRLGTGHYFYLVNRASFPVEAYVAFSGRDVVLRDLGAGKEIALPYVEKKDLPAAMPKEFVSEHALPDEEGPVPAEGEKKEAVTGSLLQVRLEPYQLCSYRVATTGTSITYAASEAPAAARLRSAQRLESAKGLVANSNAEAEVLNAARATLDLATRAWHKRELSRLEYLLDSYPLARLR